MTHPVTQTALPPPLEPAPLFVVTDDTAASAIVAAAHAAYRQADAAYQATVATCDLAGARYYRRTTGVNTAEVATFNAAHRAMSAAYTARDTAYYAWRAAFATLTPDDGR